MNALYYKDNEHEPNNLHGMYNKEEDVIILPDTWDIRNPWDQGVLLHEMVHYYQDVNEMKFEKKDEVEFLKESDLTGHLDKNSKKEKNGTSFKNSKYADDYQLSEALNLLKGLNILSVK